MFPAKAKYGGNDNLREVSTAEKIKHLPRKIYGRMLKVAKMLHMDRMIQGAIRMLKGRK